MMWIFWLMVKRAAWWVLSRLVGLMRGVIGSRIVKSMARHALTGFGLMLVQAGYLEADQWAYLEGGAVMAIGLIWAAADKRVPR